MDISSIQNSGGLYGYTGASSSNSLSEEDQETLSEILEKYKDSEKSPETMDAIRSEMENAGIEPSKEVMEIMDDAGFTPPPPPPQNTQTTEGSTELYDQLLAALSEQEKTDEIHEVEDADASDTALTDEQKETLSSILEKYDPDSMDPDQMEALKTELEDAGFEPSKEVMDAMQDAGFQPPPPPPPGGEPPAEELNTSSSTSSLEAILQALSNSDQNHSELSSLLSSLQNRSAEEMKGILYDNEG